ncbi:recombinase family protein [Streptomyces sp. A13(2022)]|uniref:recombinase family protein n=1 Tax=Streptomyces sp. A13(2022) TaxID=2964768 RepID=UPI0021DAE2AB|nr:recombinase family protein [Streptomyces sp. A13(2022)]
MAASRGTILIPAARSVVKASELIPVIGYARVSTWREEMISVDIQKSVVEDAAARRGRYVAEWVIDDDATGRNFKRRVMHAIEIVEDPGRPERELWSWKFSRFGRNRHGVAINLARIESVGGELISATEEVDAKTAVGRFTRGMLLEIAAFESDRAGEQWKETHELRRNMGLPATGGKRFGYRWYPRVLPDGEGGWRTQEERYEVLVPHAEPSLEAVQRYNMGKTGFGTIARWWNDLGLLNTRGAPWQDQTVKWYMDSGFPAGLLTVHKPDTGCANPARCQKRDHYDYRPAEHEAIWDGDEWDNYRDRREERRLTPARALAPVYPLAGLPKCGICFATHPKRAAARIHQKSKDTPGYAYRCGPRSRGLVDHESVWTRRSLVEERVHEWLHEVRDEIDAIVSGRIVLPKPTIAPDVTKKRKRLEREISKLQSALDRATTGYSMGDVPRDTYLRTRDKLTDDAAAKQKDLDALGPEQPAEPPSPVPHRETVLGLLAEWDTISVASKRVTLARLIRRVELWPDDRVEVIAVWAPPDPEPAAG